MLCKRKQANCGVREGRESVQCQPLTQMLPPSCVDARAAFERHAPNLIGYMADELHGVVRIVFAVKPPKTEAAV